jgi:hypothetical protein
LQAGAQTTLASEPFGLREIGGVDARNVLYLDGTLGFSKVEPGTDELTLLKFRGYPMASTLAVARDGTLNFVGLDGTVHMVRPGSTTPEPLPFDRLQEWSNIAVARDGTVYLGDGARKKLLSLAPGASEPTELPVDGVDGPGHMVIDADDTLYVSMMGEVGRIPKGATTTEPVVGVSDNVGGLAVDAAGNLYATDPQANTVSRMPAGGGDWVQLPLRGLQNPTDVSVDGDGNVYVIHQRDQLVRLAAK